MSTPECPDDTGPAPVTDAHAVEDLTAPARSVVWQLQSWLRTKARSPVYALLGSDQVARTDVARTLCATEAGLYLHLSNYVRSKVLADPSFRTEWITPGYLAELVIDLSRSCSAPLLVVDGWEVVLGLVQQATPDALDLVLRALVYRPLPGAVVVVLGPGPGGYKSVSDVRRAMETEGRRRVVVLAGDAAGEEG